MPVGLVLGILPIVGVLTGLAGARFPRVPAIAAGLVVLGYLGYLAVIGVWAAPCWDCRGLSETRGELFLVAATFFGINTAITLLAIWLGNRFGVVLLRLLRTVRELREGRG